VNDTAFTHFDFTSAAPVWPLPPETVMV